MSNPEQTNNTQFIDMSRTINQTSSVRANGAGTSQPVARGDTGTPNIRERNPDEVQKSLEDKVKKLIEAEMLEIRKCMDQLTKSVADLAKMTAHESNMWSPYNEENDSGNATRESESSQAGFRNDVRLTSQSGSLNGATGAHALLPVQNVNYSTLNHQTAELPRIRVDKLGISFDGNPAHISIDDFVFRLEHLQRHYQIPWTEVLRDFHLLMTGAAREWYWLFIKTHGIVEWAALRHSLLAQYQTTKSNFEIMRDLVERKQQSGETIDNYFQAMCQIRSRLKQPIPEYDLIKIIKRNIRESIGRIVYPISVSSVEQLRVECNEAERNFPRRDFRVVQPMQKPNKYINEVYIENENVSNEIEESPQHEQYEEICAISVNTQQKKQALVCWNCRQPGHVYMDCTSIERNLFCYKCGRANVITPKCPNCQSGNQSRSLCSTGESSVSGNQTPRQK